MIIFTSLSLCLFSSFFSFKYTPTTYIYTLSLHDALPISYPRPAGRGFTPVQGNFESGTALLDRKSTRLNSSHEWISYAVFCLKKKNLMVRRVVVLCGHGGVAGDGRGKCGGD